MNVEAISLLRHRNAIFIAKLRATITSNHAYVYCYILECIGTWLIEQLDWVSQRLGPYISDSMVFHHQGEFE